MIERMSSAFAKAAQAMRKDAYGELGAGDGVVTAPFRSMITGMIKSYEERHTMIRFRDLG